MHRHWKWYIAPLNSHTNEVISRNLPEENMQRDVACKHGVEPCLWECPRSIVTFLMKSRTELALKFKILNREGNGQIRDCTNLYVKIKRKPAPAPAPATATI
jgi:hypothetical protein